MALALPATTDTTALPDYERFEYTETLVDNPMGGVSVTVKGPLGAMGVLASINFQDPGSVFTGVAVAKDLLADFGVKIPYIGPILGLIAAFIPTADVTLIRHQQVMTTLNAIGQSLQAISSQLDIGFTAIMDFQIQQTEVLRDLILQLTGDRQVAFQYVYEMLVEKTDFYISELQNLQIETQTTIDGIYSDALTEGDAMLWGTLQRLSDDYTQSKIDSLQLLSAVIAEMGLKIGELDADFLWRIRALNEIQTQINNLTIIESNGDLKIAADVIVGKFEPQLVPMIGRTINRIDFSTQLPERPRSPIDPEIEWPTAPTPQNIDAMIAYKQQQLDFKSNAMVDQFIGYMKQIFDI